MRGKEGGPVRQKWVFILMWRETETERERERQREREREREWLWNAIELI